MPEERIPATSTFVKVYIGLIALTLLTTGVAYIDLQKFTDVAVLAIAAAKTLLVVLYFMQVKYQRKLVFVFASAGFVWLAILMVLTSADYLTRGWLPAPGELPPLHF